MSNLSTSQITQLISRYVSDPALVQQVVSALQNLGSNDPLSIYIQQVDTASGAPLESLSGYNNISISPDAQAILNAGSYSDGTNSFLLATDLKLNAALNNNSVSDYYQIGDTQVGQLANEAYVNGSSGEAISPEYQAIEEFASSFKLDQVDTQAIIKGVQNYIGGEASAIYIQDAPNPDFVSFTGNNTDLNNTEQAVEFPEVAARDGSVNGVAGSEIPLTGC